MKKNNLIVSIILFLLCSTIANAQYTKLPTIPNNTFLVTDFDAIGDGKTLNTTAIQQALDKAKAEGGRVIIPKGVFLCGPIKMYSRTNLEIQKGAVLRLRNDIDSFPAEKERYLNFIHVSNVTDIKISGEGTIDGQGEIWWKKFTAKEITYRRPQMMFIEKAERVEIGGITYLNPPNTHLSLKNTTDVYIHNITIQAPADSRNTDGINISTKNCTIENCSINTGDDNIAINFGNKNNAVNDPECKNIMISNCAFGYGHGLSIGSYTSGGLKNLNVSNCTFEGTTSAIRIKTARGRGGLVEDVTYTDIKISNSKWPIFISEYYPKEPATPEADSTLPINDKTPTYKNFTLKNITIANAQDAIKIWGIPESPIQHIQFINVNIAAKKAAQIYNAKNIEFVKSSIIVDKGDKLLTYNADVKGL